MIELEEEINTRTIEQIHAERMRKSSRLLKDANSLHKINPKSLESGDKKNQHSCSWKPQRYAELMKILRKPNRQEKERFSKRSLNSSHLSHLKDMNNHFKKSHKTLVESEVNIASYKEHKLSKKFISDEIFGKNRQRSNHHDRPKQLNTLKVQLNHFFSKKHIKHSRLSFIKHVLKIQDEEKEENENFKNNQLIKESIILKPIKMPNQKLSSEKPIMRLFLKQQSEKEKVQYSQIPKYLIERIMRKKSKKTKLSESLNLKKFQLSGWTFHNIQQQIK